MCFDCQCIIKKAKHQEITLSNLAKVNDLTVISNSKKQDKDSNTGTILPLCDKPKKINRRTKSCAKLNEINNLRNHINDGQDENDDDKYDDCYAKKSIINNNNCNSRLFEDKDNENSKDKENTKDKENEHQTNVPPRSFQSSNMLKGVRRDLIKNAF